MAGSCSSLGVLAKWIITYRRIVISFWVLMTLGLVYFAPAFADAASITFDPPPGTRSYDAFQKMAEVMPVLTETAQFVCMIEDSHKDVLKIPGIANFADRLQNELNSTGRLITFFPSGSLLNMTFFGTTDPPTLVSDDGSSTIFVFMTADSPTSMEIRDWAKDFMAPTWDRALQEWKDEYGVADRIEFAGTMSFAQVATQAIDVSKTDMEHVDAISLPLAGLILYFVVQSARLLLITLCAMSVSAIIACGVLYIMSLVLVVEAITPPLVMCLLIALSIDYSLFLLTRFREELLANGFDQATEPDAFPKAKYETCIVKTMETSGATIAISGIILAVAFVFLAMFPINLIASMGLGCFITMMIMMSVNLTLSPALLATFPVFFSTSARRDRMGASFWRAVCRKESGPQMTPRVGAHTAEEAAALNGGWAKIGRCATTFPYNIIILSVIVLVVGLFSSRITTIKTTNDLKQDVAYGSDLYDLIVRLMSNFGGGVAFPYNVLVIPTAESGMTVFSSKFFAESGACFQKVHQEFSERLPYAVDTGFAFLSYIGPSGASGAFKVSWTMMNTFCFPHGPIPAIGAGACQDMMTLLTNSPNYLNYPPTAMSGMVIPTIDPLGKDGQEFLDTLVELFDKHGAEHGLQIYVGGTAAYATDMVRSVFGTLPIMIAATLTVAGLFLAVTFRSVIIPLRAILSNILCLGLTYGISIIVYQDGILNWMNWNPVSGELGAMPWIVPVVVFFVLTGIGLDYDVFLCVRITEYRNDGIEPTQAIVNGLSSVAGIIASAGLVMVVAFGSLMFSSIQQLNMLGFMMVVSVTFCTGIACVLVNPATMSLLGYYNWWPSALAKKTTNDTRSFLGASMQEVGPAKLTE